MSILLRTGRFFYGIAIVVYGVLQIRYKDFRSVIVPQWPHWLHLVPLVYVSGLALITAGLLISGIFPVHEDRVRKACLLLGGCFFVILLFCHVPLNLFISPNSPLHLGVWAEALKELALCGGAFVIAGSYKPDSKTGRKTSLQQTGLSLLIPVGRIFFSTTMILFGVSHFYYTSYVSPMVPKWFGMPVFWTYFGGIALIGAGISIVSGIAAKQVAFLLALMLIIWFLVIHIPNAIAHPATAGGNEIASAFDALLFCGVSLAIGYNYLKYSTQNIIPKNY